MTITARRTAEGAGASGDAAKRIVDVHLRLPEDEVTSAMVLAAGLGYDTANKFWRKCIRVALLHPEELRLDAGRGLEHVDGVADGRSRLGRIAAALAAAEDGGITRP